MVNYPTIKKKIKHFIENEEGKISKEKFITTGLIISALALSQNVSAGGGKDGGSSSPTDSVNGGECNSDAGCTHGNSNHVNSLTLSQSGVTGSASHSHCVGSHSNHCSY